MSVPPDWYSARAIARAEQLGTAGERVWRTFDQRERQLLDSALGGAVSGDAFALAAARLALLGPRRMPPGAIMADIDWVMHTRLGDAAELGTRVEVTERTDSTARRWLTARADVADRSGARVADLTFVFLWPDEA